MRKKLVVGAVIALFVVGLVAGAWVLLRKDTPNSKSKSNTLPVSSQNESLKQTFSDAADKVGSTSYTYNNEDGPKLIALANAYVQKQQYDDAMKTLEEIPDSADVMVRYPKYDLLLTIYRTRKESSSYELTKKEFKKYLEAHADNPLAKSALPDFDTVYNYSATQDFQPEEGGRI